MPYDQVTDPELDFKSPIDETLLRKYRDNQDFFNAQLSGGSTATFRWVVNGSFEDYDFDNDLKNARELDGSVVSQVTTPSRCRAFLRDPGVSGDIELDIKRWRNTDLPIIGIDHQFSESINSITRIAPAIATQSITRATPQIATQSITRVEATRNIQSILKLPAGKARIELDGGVFSANFVVGKYIENASATSAVNDGILEILELEQDHGTTNLIVSNGSAIDQTSAAGTLDLQLFSYDLINPANASFVAGESFLSAAHTSALNDGTILIEAVNDAGNNLTAYNQNGVTQGGVAGTIDCLRFIYTMGSAPSVTDFIVGESFLGSAHTSALSDGNKTILVLSGSQITVFDATGVIQGGVAGTVDTNRWVIALPTDQSAGINVGETVDSVDTTATTNEFLAIEVKEINRSATNNFVVFSETAVTQGGAAGTVRHTRKLVKFSVDNSASFTNTTSLAELENVILDKTYNDQFVVIEQNRGGGANYNIVIDNSGGISIALPLGNVANEGQSLFTTLPKITTIDRKQSVIADGNLVGSALAAEDILLLDITELPLDQGLILAGNLTVELS